MVAHSGISITILLGVAVLSCAGGRAWTKADPWYAPPPDTLPRGQELEASQVFVVPESHKAEATALLQGATVVELDREVAASWVGAVVGGTGDEKPFLVRGVYLNPSHFSVRQAPGVLHVHASCLGRHAVPMRRQPLVVLLRERPREVYVTCSMAE